MFNRNFIKSLATSVYTGSVDLTNLSHSPRPCMPQMKKASAVRTNIGKQTHYLVHDYSETPSVSIRRHSTFKKTVIPLIGIKNNNAVIHKLSIDSTPHRSFLSLVYKSAKPLTSTSRRIFHPTLSCRSSAKETVRLKSNQILVMTRPLKAKNRKTNEMLKNDVKYDDKP